MRPGVELVAASALFTAASVCGHEFDFAAAAGLHGAPQCAGQTARIHVFVPHYHNEADMATCLCLQSSRADADFDVTVLNMGGTVTIPANVTVKPLAVPPKEKGGSALPYFFRAVGDAADACDIVVLSDTDAFLIADSWDTKLRKIMSSHIAAGINPRSKRPQFKNTIEWNWSAYHGWFFKRFADPHLAGLHDWGEWYANAAIDLGGRVFRWPHARTAGTAVVASHTETGDWALHKFFGSWLRHFPDKGKPKHDPDALTRELRLPEGCTPLSSVKRP